VQRAWARSAAWALLPLEPGAQPRELALGPAREALAERSAPVRPKAARVDLALRAGALAQLPPPPGESGSVSA